MLLDCNALKIAPPAFSGKGCTSRGERHLFVATHGADTSDS
jgi:hypothetical protein